MKGDKAGGELPALMQGWRPHVPASISVLMLKILIYISILRGNIAFGVLVSRVGEELQRSLATYRCCIS
jgi:hypothetical protein